MSIFFKKNWVKRKKRDGNKKIEFEPFQKVGVTMKIRGRR
jgi:hypothetical protein